ncbi:TetR/AcrR family transcriptional regulator [Hyphomicrobium sp. CS1GBMeth3]|uniref:TetR/AcrR family transcriptional regulator n=1 Tax=Hyphomicrobium sp. CS1GBMeth3 TaxID=1892845 RepID=UPI00093169C2|nr:TetR/AcrR family transcriptional regulator [Hyphomicrobium sp. CS1GBMeth3]
MENDPPETEEEPEGLREKKRRETLQRIADTGLRLFVANGFEATTLDAIAEAAGISRRTIFYYFKSKEEILLTWQRGVPEIIRTAVLQESTDQPPLDAVCNAFLKLAAAYSSEHMIVVDRLMRSTEQLVAAKHAKYVLQEQALFEALCQMWPQAKRRNGLRIVAMASIGAMRLAIEAWVEAGGKQPIEKYLREAFAALKSEI